MHENMSDSDRKNNIKDYWNDRARRHRMDPQATTNDAYLRELEVRTILKTIDEVGFPEDSQILDLGCADGFSTIKLAEALPNSKIIGIDYGQDMIEIAKEKLNLKPELKERLEFSVGDASSLSNIENSTFNLVLTDRLLINLDSKETQKKALSEIHDKLLKGGYYVAIENFLEGHQNMNKARSCVGLPEIPLRWHNLFLEKEEFFNNISELFELVSVKDFASAYYFATRVVYSKMCKMQNKEPDYYHDIHKLSIDLPWFGEFCPVKMVVMRKKE